MKSPDQSHIVDLIYLTKKHGPKTLDLSNKSLTNIPLDVFKLTQLENLNIGGNPLKTILPEIRNLFNLKTLDIHGANIKNLPVEIGELRKLEHLDLNGNELKELPFFIGHLSKLRNLLVVNNQIKNISDGLVELRNLTNLDLHGNNLTEIDFQLGRLVNLERLNLSDNALITFPSSICSLAKLTDLRISHNKIRELPKQFRSMRSLRYFDLGNNNLIFLPEEVGELSQLKTLDISNNKITILPQSIAQLDLKKLNISGNQIPIPPEIIENAENPQSIFKYYFKLQTETHHSLLEAKALVVGQGSVGKTSLIFQILYGTFEQNQNKTEGININQWQVEGKQNREREQQSEIEKRKSEIKLNIWDFGGQEIMHATHQFFLTKRSLYLLVIDSRLTQEENRIEYWLKIIQSFSDESPVLIVGNKIDQHPLDIDRTGLQKKYPNIVGIIETSAATGAGIEELKAAITEQVNNLPHIRDLLPETWFTVKTKLEEMGKGTNFISHDDYDKLCDNNDVHDEVSQHTLIGFLHDLGVVLYFQDDPRLEALGILNPQWVTNGVYKILNSHTLFQNKGVLTTSMLDEILNLPEYPRGKRLFIVDMMKKFELCYDIEPDKTFLVPDLLPKDEPAELKFNGVPAFEYAYPVLPSSVITRFIVRMNQKIEDGFVWRTGVVLKIGENAALVKADIEDRKITIAIDGLEHTRRDALSAIRYQLDEIHGSIKGLNPQKMVPIPNAPNAEPIEYDYLLMLEREGQETHLVKDGNRLVKINVREVLSAIENESQRKEIGGNVTNIYIGGNVQGSNIISGDNNVVTQNIRDSFNKAESADIQAELKETLKQLATAVDAMSKSLPTEQAIEVTEDLGKLVDEATKPKPNKKWYSVSIEGLIKAAENLDKLGEPVINLSRKVLSLLTGGVIK